MEKDQAALLYRALQAKQAQYATSLADDTQFLARLGPPQSPATLEGSPRRLQMALQVRIGEKEILHAVLAMLDSFVAGGSLKRTANGDGDESRQFKAPRV